MMQLPPLEPEMADLLESLCLGEITSEQAARLESLVLSSEACCEQYVAFLHMHALAERFEGGDASLETMFDCPPVDVEPVPLFAEEPVALCGGRAEKVSFGASNIGIRGGMASFSSRELFTGYIVATVLFAIATIVGLNVYVARHQSSDFRAPIVEDGPRRPRHDYAMPETPNKSVAKIVHMVDCVWEKPDGAPIIDRIKLHDRFALKSGLLEIAYYTGARVILQGPCRYEVESRAGGFLQVGKVVARIEKKGTEKKGTGGAGRGTGEGVTSGEWRMASPPLPPGEGRVREMRQQQMAASDAVASASGDSPAPRPTPPAPLFAIRTPMATVTDLGTEFGVEATKNGESRVVVFAGEVISTATNPSNKKTTSVRLKAGQSATVQRDGAIVQYSNADRHKQPKFVRVCKKRPSSFISGITVTASSCAYEGETDRRPMNLVNNNGFDPVRHSVTAMVEANGITWNSRNGATRAETWVMFDLGKVRSVCEMHVFNFNNAGECQRDFRYADIWCATDPPTVANPTDAAPGNWTKFKSQHPFAPAPFTTDYNEPNVIGLNMSARYVLLNNIENYGETGHGNGYGLSKVEFTESAPIEAQEKESP